MAQPIEWYLLNYDFYLEEQKFICSNYPQLHYKETEDGELILIGNLDFQAVYKKKNISASYTLIVSFPSDYPKNLPIINETRNKIDPEFHTNYDGTLCLGVVTEIMEIFNQKPTIENFIESILIPYLYAHASYKLYGIMPWGERSHGKQGIVEYYSELFNVNDTNLIIKFLQIFQNNDYRGHLPCPCGSGLKFKKCHSPLIFSGINIHRNHIIEDLNYLKSREFK